MHALQVGELWLAPLIERSHEAANGLRLDPGDGHLHQLEITCRLTRQYQLAIVHTGREGCLRPRRCTALRHLDVAEAIQSSVAPAPVHRYWY